MSKETTKITDEMGTRTPNIVPTYLSVHGISGNGGRTYAVNFGKSWIRIDSMPGDGDIYLTHCENQSLHDSPDFDYCLKTSREIIKQFIGTLDTGNYIIIDRTPRTD